MAVPQVLLKNLWFFFMRLFAERVHDAKEGESLAFIVSRGVSGEFRLGHFGASGVRRSSDCGVLLCLIIILFLTFSFSNSRSFSVSNDANRSDVSFSLCSYLSQRSRMHSTSRFLLEDSSRNAFLSLFIILSRSSIS